jgi:hypothetical protein
VKTLVDEQKIQSIPAISREGKKPQVVINGTGSQRKEISVTPSAPQSSTDCYESCLDLSAEFLARG